MSETIIEKQKRFITINEYCKRTGLSYATVNHMLKDGQLSYITTEGGLRRIDTQNEQPSMDVVLKRMDEQERLLKSLCGHLGVT